MFSCLLCVCLVARRTDVNAPCHLHSHRIHRQSSQFWVRALAMLRTKSEYDLLSACLPLPRSACARLCARCVVNWCAAHVFVLCVRLESRNSKNCFYLKIHRKKGHSNTRRREKEHIETRKNRRQPIVLCLWWSSAPHCFVLCCLLCAVFPPVSVFIFDEANAQWTLLSRNAHSLTHTHVRMQSVWLESARARLALFEMWEENDETKRQQQQ